jgi:hypothetical protein
MEIQDLAPPEPDGRQQNLGWCSAEVRAVGVGEGADGFLERCGLEPAALVAAGFVFGSEQGPWPWPLGGTMPAPGDAWVSTRPTPVHEQGPAGHLGALLDLVEPVAAAVHRELDAVGGRLLLELETTTSVEPAGPLLEADLLARVAELGAALSLDQRCGLEHSVN